MRILGQNPRAGDREILWHLCKIQLNSRHAPEIKNPTSSNSGSGARKIQKGKGTQFIHDTHTYTLTIQILGPDPIHLWHYSANEPCFTPPCRAAFCWVPRAQQTSTPNICVGERRNCCSICLQKMLISTKQH